MQKLEQSLICRKRSGSTVNYPPRGRAKNRGAEGVEGKNGEGASILLPADYWVRALPAESGTESHLKTNFGAF